MKKVKLVLANLLALTFLSGCSTNNVTFTLSFYQDEGNKLDKIVVTKGKTTIEQVKSFQDAITVNPRRGYDTTWRSYDLSSINSDYTVTMKYSLHDYTISFVNNNQVVGTTTYNIYTKEIEEPEFKGTSGYTYTYEPFSFRNKAEDFEVEATEVEKQYKVTFKRGEDDLDPIVKYYSLSNPKVYAPSGKVGYTTKWNASGLSIKEGNEINFSGAYKDYEFVGEATPNQYRITYNPNGGVMQSKTQVVTYDQPYTLKDVTSQTSLEYVGWYDENDASISETGTWTIADDVALKAKWGFSFESDEVPSSFTNQNRTLLSITDEDSTLGNKSLRIDVTNANTNNYQVILLKQTLEELFTDPEVVAVNFDARASANNPNFRSNHYESGKVSAWTYENNGDSGWGLTTTWKTFTFKREYLEGYVNFIEGWAAAGFFLLVDNIRVATKDLDGMSFETGHILTTSPNPRMYKDGGHQNANPGPVYIFMANGDPASVITSYGFSYDVKSDGLRSYKFTKGSGYVALYISQALRDSISDDGYLSFDLYTSVSVNSNPDNPRIVDGLSTGGQAKPLGDGEYQHPANKWVTYHLPKSKLTADGRFLQIDGSTAGDYYIDNLIIK